MKKYVTVRQLAEYCPVFKESTLRSLIFHREKNGLTSCIRKVGKKVLIDLEAFEIWIDKQKILPGKDNSVD